MKRIWWKELDKMNEIKEITQCDTINVEDRDIVNITVNKDNWRGSGRQRYVLSRSLIYTDSSVMKEVWNITQHIPPLWIQQLLKTSW